MEEQVHLSRSGRPIDCQTNVLTEICYDPLLAGEKHTYCMHRSMPAWSSWSQPKRELQRPEEGAYFECSGFTFLASVAWNRVQIKCEATLTGFYALLLHIVPHAPETTDANGRQSPCVWTWSKPKFLYHTRTNEKPWSDILCPKVASEAISVLQNPHNFSRGARSQTV